MSRSITAEQAQDIMYKSEVGKKSIRVTIEVETSPDGATRLLEAYFDACPPLEEDETVDVAIKRCIKQGKSKLDTIKEIKVKFNLGLKEAKDLCDPYNFPPI